VPKPPSRWNYFHLGRSGRRHLQLTNTHGRERQAALDFVNAPGQRGSILSHPGLAEEAARLNRPGSGSGVRFASWFASRRYRLASLIGNAVLSTNSPAGSTSAEREEVVAARPRPTLPVKLLNVRWVRYGFAVDVIIRGGGAKISGMHPIAAAPTDPGDVRWNSGSSSRDDLGRLDTRSRCGSMDACGCAGFPLGLTITVGSSLQAVSVPQFPLAILTERGTSVSHLFDYP